MFGRPGRRRGGEAGPEKHLPWFKFIDNCAKPGCPVCLQSRAAVGEWFENLLYESANDRPFRRRFDAERGFCARHAHLLCAGTDGLGAAIIYRNLLEWTVAALDRGAPPPLNAGTCSACDHESDAEARLVGLVADFLGDEELRKGLGSSGGLCMPHAAAVLRLRPSPPAWFLELHRGRCDRLHAVLLRYIDGCKLSTEERKAALSFEDEMAWKGLAPLLAGEAG